MEQLTIRMPKSDIIKMEQIAKRFGLKKSDITRMAIKKFIDAEGGHDHRSAFEKVRHLIGISESGIPDLGLNHREYLTRKIKKQK